MGNEGPRLGFRQLDGAYRQTWKQFCAEVAVLELLLSDVQNGPVIEGVRNRVARAERSYRESRDNLAQYMIANAPGGSARKLRPADEEMPGTRRIRLERLAYKFWQDGGRHHGNADADWYRAEASLRI